MWHKPCRTFHPWCPCIKTRCLLLVVVSIQSIELPASCHGIKSRTGRQTELIPQAATSGSVISQACTKQHPHTVPPQSRSSCGHETAPKHCHLAGVTSRARNSPQTLPSRGRHRAAIRVYVEVVGLERPLNLQRPRTVLCSPTWDVKQSRGSYICSLWPVEQHFFSKNATIKGFCD